MTTPNSQAPLRRGISIPDLLLALGVLALGAFFLLGARGIEGAAGCALIGPRVSPQFVGIGLLAVGALLAVDTLRGGRAEPAAEEDADPDAPINWRSVAWVSLGVVLDILLLNRLGFILTSAVLFWCVARGFHSRAPLRDLAIAVLLSVIVYLAFTRGLGLTLPPGVLSGLL